MPYRRASLRIDEYAHSFATCASSKADIPHTKDIFAGRLPLLMNREGLLWLCQAVCLDARANSRRSESKAHLHSSDPVIVIC